MRTNLPVTNVEREFRDGETIVSKTDLKGVITYVNPYFCEMSGYSEQESIGQPHNYIRHPDMPEEAFADLWATLKKGKPWTGMVKNRCKNGDHYWVEANATPIKENGHVVGYMSVRSKVSRTQIEATAKIYQEIREGKSKYKVREGKAVKPGLFDFLGRIRNLKLGVKLGLGFGLVLALLAVIAFIGITQLGHLNDNVEQIVHDRYTKISTANEALKHIDRQARAMRNILLMSDKAQIEKEVAIVIESRKIVGEQVAQLEKTITSEKGRELMKGLAEVRAKYTELRDRFLKLIADGKNAEAKDLLLGELRPVQVGYFDQLNNLIEFQHEEMENSGKDAVEAYHAARNLMLILTIVAVLAGALLAFLITRAIVRPLQIAINTFDKMGQGHYYNKIEADSADEIGQVMYGLKSTQIKLGFDINEAQRRADESLRITNALNNASTGVMIADNDLNIIYLNQAVQDMLKNAEADIKKDLPNFNADKLLGVNIDVFHKNPAHQRQLLKTFTATFEAAIKIGGRTFRLSANPVFNTAGQRLGASVEWIDATAEVKVQDEIQHIVAAAVAGDLSQRVRLEDKKGFMKVLGEEINNLTQVSADVINETVRVMEHLAQGDLTQTIDRDYQGTFKRLTDATNSTVGKLATTINEVRGSADVLSNASEQVNATAQSISQATSEQASSVEETSASIEQMSASINQNTDNAKVTDSMASQAAKQAGEGGQAVKDTVVAMKSIAGKIGIIDDIAYQTNLLALNAAIEAARAGEHGKGFAVVAAEVRKLAERSQVAAQEISELASGSVDKAETAGKLLDEMVPSISKTSDLVQEIAAASSEQSTGVGQINTAMNQLNQITQQNASASEELAATAEEMTGQVERLQQLMAFFKVDTSATPASQAPAAARTVPKKAAHATQSSQKAASGGGEPGFVKF